MQGFVFRGTPAGLYSSAVLICFLASASPAAVAAPHRVLDLRNQSDADGEYAISLCARTSPGPAGLPGHAFVTYSFKPTSGERKVASVGYTTADSAIKGVLSFSALFATPAGFLGEEKYTSINENCLVALVNKAQFNQAVAVAKPFANVPGLESLQYAGIYSLTNKDCITFVTKVSETLKPNGLKVPTRVLTDTPPVYVRKLVDAN